MKFIKKNLFIIIFLILFIVSDCIMSNSRFIINSRLFWLNDFEITQRHHPEEVWDKVVFGSSELVSGFSEELSSTDYVNCGMDYGLITDLEKMLRRGDIKIGSELVLALGWGTLYDGIGTNETYIWHRDWYEPYVYFERDRFGKLISDGFERILRGEPFIAYHYDNEKYLYSGQMTHEELAERMQKLYELFWSNGIEAYSDNLSALDRVFDYCEANNIRVRAIWLPINPSIEPNEVDIAVRDLAREACERRGVEFADWTFELPAECFYDTGHMNKEIGMVTFTEEFDKWLTK